jgi:hypothetical protein
VSALVAPDVSAVVAPDVSAVVAPDVSALVAPFPASSSVQPSRDTVTTHKQIKNACALIVDRSCDVAWH